MRKLIPLVLLICMRHAGFAQNNIGIGTPTPDPSAILDLTASDKGFLAPRLTTAQRLAISTPGPGLLVYDTNIGCYFYYNGQWNSLCQLSGPTGATGAPGVQGVTGPTGPGAICNTAASGYITMFTSPSALCNSVLFQSGNNVGLNTTTPAVSFQDNATDAIGLPAGTTAQEPAGAPVGAIRYNTTLSTVEVYNGTCWQNINTPPIGSTYIQWFSAADPNTLYPCTQWISSDIDSGQFIRASGGASNIVYGTPLSGITQAQELLDHTHNFSGTIDSAGPFNTDTTGAHTHNWGGNWSTDNSQLYDTSSGNGDGNGNTISDGSFWWGGNPLTTGNPNPLYYVGSSGGVNFSTPMWIVYDDNTSSDTQAGGFTSSNPTLCGSGWNGQPTAGNFMGQLSGACLAHTHEVDFYAHRHFIKMRPTDSNGLHFHTVPAHTHTFNFNVGNVNSGQAGPENRPANVAVVFWRRTN